ncbi:MAG: hypothetical protein JRD89_02730 [Deltaproteobacteria bacterium]|nr:hypothetical protein [Deltaproteobacteria bacterium]
MTIKLNFNSAFAAFTTPFIVYEPVTEGGRDYSSGGEWQSPTLTAHLVSGIIVPISELDRLGEGGRYTTEDIRIYYQGRLGIGWEVEWEENRYQIAEERLLETYGEFNEYLAKRIGEVVV